MTNNQLTREENVQAVFDLKAGYTLGLADVEILKRVARMALAAMDSEPVVPEEIKRNPETGWYVGPDGKNWSALQANSWNACRSAMLQAGYSPAHSGLCPEQSSSPPAQDGSSPAQNQGWIPVSERMPEVGVKVLSFPAEDEPIHAIFNGQLWLQDISWSSSDEPIDNVIPRNVTHWMPLPAAPQEVK